MVDIKDVEKFFFKAMVEGWVVDAKEITIPNMPGHKGIPFQDGYFRLWDYYCVNSNSHKSAGTTTIWFNDVPVWFMSYGGFYPKETVPLLKSALLNFYKACIFFGGRGPASFYREPLSYINKPEFSNFEKFKGHEEIIDAEGVDIGWYDYWGMSLM